MLVEEKSELLEELIKIVGDRYATNDQAICIGYSRDQVITSKGPEYVVAPETTEEIQKIMRVATKYKVPVLPKGTGANMGGLVIPLHGGIILDLKRMNQIYEFDEKNMTAIVGPGVTYGQLQIDGSSVVITSFLESKLKSPETLSLDIFSMSINELMSLFPLESASHS